MEPDYYSTPGAFTDLDRHGDVVGRITGNTREMVAGLIRHVDWARAHDGQLPDPAHGELWIRAAARSEFPRAAEKLRGRKRIAGEKASGAKTHRGTRRTPIE
jgi:hypothetical protein